jgi:DNA excision repair protein ERCC-4
MYYEQPNKGMPDSDVQVYKASNPGLGVRVYFMIYQMTAEEHKYLASLRKEKDSFERLIRERGVSTQPVVQKDDVTKL